MANGDGKRRARFCSSCGARIPEGSAFCEECGKPVGENRRRTAGHAERMPAQYAPREARGGNRKYILIAVAALFIAAAGCIGGFTFFQTQAAERDYNAQMEEAQLYVDADDLDLAKKIYLNLIEVQPKQAPAYIRLSELYLVQLQLEDALDVLEKGSEQAKDTTEIEQKLAQIEELIKKGGRKAMEQDDTDSDEDEPDEEEAAVDLFEEMADTEFLFTSGAGGWSTILNMKEDGSFDGRYHDSDYDQSYECSFHGKFGDVKKSDDGEYTMRLIDDIQTDQEEGDTGEEEGTPVEYTTPYGLENLEEGDTVKVLAPGYDTVRLGEDARSWFYGATGEDDPGILDDYCIYNEEEEYVFVGQ